MTTSDLSKLLDEKLQPRPTLRMVPNLRKVSSIAKAQSHSQGETLLTVKTQPLNHITIDILYS